MTGQALHHLLAAKFGRESVPSAAPAYHPLICHMADVAAVATAMWELVLPASSRSIIAAGLGLPDEDAREWVAFIAGCHDLGKATRQFQAKDRNHATRLSTPGFTASDPRKDPGHGMRTAGFFCEYATELGVGRPIASQLGIITGGHHGRFLVPEWNSLSAQALEESRQPTWRQARDELFADFKKLFALRSLPSAEPTPQAGMLLAGLISVSDWVGSFEERFAYDPQGAADPAAYYGRVREVARQVIREDRWVPGPVPRVTAFSGLFPFPPRRLQSVVEALATKVGTPGLVIIEAPMGEGKTEAALYLAHQWEARGARGSYIALPTQATANQMDGRVREFLARRDPAHPANLVLAHGGAWEQPRYVPSAIHGDDDPRADAVAATEWFLSKKRALLAPYGVGTVDQALMAVLQVRHVFVRLFGLAGKPVVIDEVHAYDTYMTGLLERLLEWLAALGSPVVLLSATLPSGRRERLLDAYRRGMGSTAEAPPVPAYPRVTWVDASASGAEYAEPDGRSARSLAIERVEDSNEVLVRALSDALREGGCAAVICNTVGRAQEVYRALSVAFAPGRELGLFHARFIEEDRRRIEADCLRRFGPPAKATDRPPRFVLVATQVIEQSLDVDFDVMFTELAPADLLLQRSGRLQRHGRGQRTPVLRVLWPGTDEDGLPRFERRHTSVYDEHILLRTWHALKERRAIAIPGEVQELVDLVYRDDEGTPADADDELARRWHMTWAEMSARREREENEAQTTRLDSPLAELSIESYLRHPREEDEDLHPKLQALTRLAEPSFSVVLAPEGYALPSELDGDTVRFLLGRSVSVSHRGLVPVLRDLEPPAAFQKRAALRRHRMVVLDGSGSAVVGRWRLTYSRDIGLEIADAAG